MSFVVLGRGCPGRVPFYLYGDRTRTHLDHVLKTSPSARISADRVQVGDEQLSSSVVVVLEDVFGGSFQLL